MSFVAVISNRGTLNIRANGLGNRNAGFSVQEKALLSNKLTVMLEKKVDSAV